MGSVDSDKHADILMHRLMIRQNKFVIASEKMVRANLEILVNTPMTLIE
jgi:hypothetical protein